MDKPREITTDSGPGTSGWRRSRAASVVAAGAVALLAVHMFFTAVYNTPSAGLKYEILPGKAADSYIRPYLVQDYKIFAPDPVDTDRQLWVRAWIQLPNGERARSEWVNTSAVELADPYRRTLRKQLSVVGAERLMAAYRGLSESQRVVAAENHHEGDALYSLRDALVAADGSNTAAVRAFIRTDNFAASYATQVAHAFWSDRGEVLAVQVRAVYDPVVRWRDRHDPDAARPSAAYTDLGWVPAMEWAGQDRDAFGDSFLGWAEKAGIRPELESAAAGTKNQGETQ